MRQWLARFCVGACVLFIPASVVGQSITEGAIAGVVRDATGAVLPGVTVEAASPALIEKVRTAVTDGQGNYKIIDLRPGTYSVTFTLPGFATVRREGLVLSAGFTATANADLRVGGVEETVTVSGASPTVDVQNVRTQTLLTQEVLDKLPAPKTIAGFVGLTLGAVTSRIPNGTGGAVSDVGGAKGELNIGFGIHGIRLQDSRQLIDGMSMNVLNAGGNSRAYHPNQVAVQEVVLATGSSTAEVENGGIQLNLVPKDGGNKFSYYFNGAYTTESLQLDNLDDELRSRGLTSAPGVREIQDWGLGVGGRIVTDKLWFYGAVRKWAASRYVPGIYFNKSPTFLAYVPDLDRPSFEDVYGWDVYGRFTWQAGAKHKLTFANNVQKSCSCNYLANLANVSPVTPEATYDVKNGAGGPQQVPQVTWNYTASSRLLVQGGLGYGRFNYIVANNPAVLPGAIRVQELRTGFIWGQNSAALGATAGIKPWLNNPLTQRFSVSYVAGSHALKVGQQLLEGFYFRDGTIDPPVWYTFLDGRPQSLTEWGAPYEQYSRIRALGLFAQDQWTMRRLTLNMGVRYDNFKGWVNAGTRPAGFFIPAYSFERVDNVPNWKDVVPRFGAAYDLFGNGRTAIKGSIGKYVSSVGSDLTNANHPVNAIVSTTTRTWNDVNGNFAPDCELRDINANGECGALANRLFGQPFRNTFYDPELLAGWGVRPYGWQGSVSVQHELRTSLALNVGYFRTWYGNHQVSINQQVAPTDFTSDCVTAPADSRLPGGGGNRICGLYDVNPAKFGQVQNLITFASELGGGKQVEQFDGVDISMSARFGRGGLLQGGMAVGRQITDTCYQNNFPNATVPAPFYVAGTPRTEEYCRVSPPLGAGTQVKVSGSYPLPWDSDVSFNLQNLSAGSHGATTAVSNAAIAPSLGRNLSAGATASVTVPLVPDSTLFLERFTQLDMRLSKNFTLRGGQVKAILDLYNLFNDNTILSVNSAFGSAWQRPFEILGGRLFKFGAQVTF